MAGGRRRPRPRARLGLGLGLLVCWVGLLGLPVAAAGATGATGATAATAAATRLGQQEKKAGAGALALPRFGSSFKASPSSSDPAAESDDDDDGKGKWDLRGFHAFVQARTGSSGQRAPALARECYWVLHGQLSNPFTGDVIAAVRGVEVVRLAGSSALPCQALPGTKKALQLAPHHTTTTAGSSSSSSGGANPSHNQWRAVASVLSAKSFRYFHPLTGQPLLTFRPSPRAKPRAVPAAVRSLQAVTYALSRRGHLHLVSESVSGGLLAVRDEGKGAGAAAVAPAATAASGKRRLVVPWSWPPPFLRRAPRRFELSLLMWPGSKQRPERRRGRASEEEGEGEAEASGGGGGWGGLTSIPWSSLVQLGASSSQPPCRELYAFSTEPARGWGRGGRRPRMRYLRYGECPHWCGAGRVCHLTLEGVRYDRYQDIPRADRALFFGEPKERKGWGRRRKGEEGEQEQQQAEAVGGGAVVTMAPPPLPLTTQDFADEMELEKRRRRKRFFFF